MVGAGWPAVAAVIAAGRRKHITEDIKKYRYHTTAARPPRLADHVNLWASVDKNFVNHQICG